MEWFGLASPNTTRFKRLSDSWNCLKAGRLCLQAGIVAGCGQSQRGRAPFKFMLPDELFARLIFVRCLGWRHREGRELVNFAGCRIADVDGAGSIYVDAANPFELAD